MNQFKLAAQMLGNLEASRQLIEFLEDSEVSLYGVSLQPTKIRKLRHELMRRFNVRPEELQE